MANDDRPLVTMDITQDPYQLLGQLGISGRAGTPPRINIDSIVGANLTRLDMPHMLEVLRSVYERKGNKLIYRPRTFRVSTQAGTLTDIQASMFKRFQTDQTEVNDLLVLLTPLIPDADEENCEAIRELVRDDVNELVEEAGWLGGPREAKFDGAYDKCLLHLEELKTALGLDEKNINTSSEAENWSRIVRIEEIVDGMHDAYESRLRYLNRKGGESFGNQVIWLSRALGTVKETSVRLRLQLRARFVGIEELNTKLIKDLNMTMTELVDWTTEVCDKGALISTRAGRSGVAALVSDLDKLKDGYDVLLKPNEIDITEVYDSKVQQTIKSVKKAIEEAKNYAASSPSPTSVPGNCAIYPSQGKRGDEIQIIVYGDNLKQVRHRDLVLALESTSAPKVKIESIRFNKIQNRRAFSFLVNLDRKLKAGKYKLVIRRTADKKPILSLPGTFTVT